MTTSKKTPAMSSKKAAVMQALTKKPVALKKKMATYMKPKAK